MKTIITINHESLTELQDILIEVMDELKHSIDEELGMENLPMTLGASDDNCFVVIKES